MTDAINATQNLQTDYLKLFMQELTYQDPLKPVDNREFMAQMAQFSALQEAHATNESLNDLVSLGKEQKSLMLLGKHIRVQGSDELLEVRSIQLDARQSPRLIVTMNGSRVFKELDEVTEIHM